MFWSTFFPSNWTTNEAKTKIYQLQVYHTALIFVLCIVLWFDARFPIISHKCSECYFALIVRSILLLFLSKHIRNIQSRHRHTKYFQTNVAKCYRLKQSSVHFVYKTVATIWSNRRIPKFVLASQHQRGTFFFFILNLLRTQVKAYLACHLRSIYVPYNSDSYSYFR